MDKAGDSPKSFPTTQNERYDWEDSQITFEPNTQHTLKFFYLERGQGTSNCSISFNMPVIAAGDVTVEKKISGTIPTGQENADSGDAEDVNEEFDFKETLSDTSINGTYGEMTFTNGVAEFKLKNNETLTVESLPAGITYTAEELDSKGYTLTTSGK